MSNDKPLITDTVKTQNNVIKYGVKIKNTKEYLNAKELISKYKTVNNLGKDKKTTNFYNKAKKAEEEAKAKEANTSTTNVLQNTTVQSTVQPTVQPTVQSTVQSTVQPTVQPTVQSTVQPTVQPTVQSTANAETPLHPSSKSSTGNVLSRNNVPNQSNIKDYYTITEKNGDKLCTMIYKTLEEAQQAKPGLPIVHIIDTNGTYTKGPNSTNVAKGGRTRRNKKVQRKSKTQRKHKSKRK